MKEVSASIIQVYSKLLILYGQLFALTWLVITEPWNFIPFQKENIIVKCFMNVLGHSTNSQAIQSHLLASDTFFIYIWSHAFHFYSLVLPHAPSGNQVVTNPTGYSLASIVLLWVNFLMQSTW